jgi:hypothetical protein
LAESRRSGRSSPERALATLEAAQNFRPSRGRAERALTGAARWRLEDAESLVRFHEAVLFLRAYPQSARVLRQAEALLREIPRRAARLEAVGADLSLLDRLEYAGMAGTTVASNFSYAITGWLARLPGVRASWEAHDAPDRLGEGLPRFLPLLEEEALADAAVPYLRWLRAAERRGERDLPWLLSRFERLPAGPEEITELFDALGVVVSWELGRSPFSRTLLRGRGPATFFHPEPLLSRREVDLPGIVAGPPMPVRRLSLPDARRAIDAARGTTAARYREFYGFTHGDPRTAVAGRPGRGVEIILFGVLPSARLPLRAMHTAIVFKNGVAVAYYEGLSFFERMEAGFNVYYTFREGESAWIYAQVLRLCRQVAGVASFSVDPYQIGFENEEAIESGAFWFYRKLGFRPTDPVVAARVAREEARMAARPGYRTPAAVLRRIAVCNLLLEVGPRRPAGGEKSEWDRFHIRRLGLAVNRRMAREFGGHVEKIRGAARTRVAQALGVAPSRWNPLERRVFESFALVLDLISDLPRWSAAEKRAVAAIVRAKAGRSESRYLRLLHRHERLRRELIRIGSRTV